MVFVAVDDDGDIMIEESVTFSPVAYSSLALILIIGLLMCCLAITVCVACHGFLESKFNSFNSDINTICEDTSAPIMRDYIDRRKAEIAAENNASAEQSKDK